VVANNFERLIGRGQSTGYKEPVVGNLYEVDSPVAAMELARKIATGDAKDVIVLVREAGGTTIGPVLDDAVGVVSTTGTKGAHIALLAREYGIPCIIGLELEGAFVQAQPVRLDPEGRIYSIDGSAS